MPVQSQAGARTKGGLGQPSMLDGTLVISEVLRPQLNWIERLTIEYPDPSAMLTRENPGHRRAKRLESDAVVQASEMPRAGHISPGIDDGIERVIRPKPVLWYDEPCDAHLPLEDAGNGLFHGRAGRPQLSAAYGRTSKLRASWPPVLGGY